MDRWMYGGMDMNGWMEIDGWLVVNGWMDGYEFMYA